MSYLQTTAVVIGGLAALTILVGSIIYLAISLWRGLTGRWRRDIREFTDDTGGTINVPYSSSDQPFFHRGGLAKLVVALTVIAAWIAFKVYTDGR
jgi:hypothetical protein